MNDILSSIYKFFLDAQLAQWQIVRISTDWQEESITFKSMHRISERDYRRDCFHLYWRSYPKNRFIECVNHNNGFGCNSFPFADIYQNQASGEEQIRITNLQKMMQDSNEIATCTIKIGFTEEKLKRRDYRQYNTKINVESISLPNSVTEIKDGAFIGCSTLESIIIPNSVTSIGDWAFDRCVNLKTIYCKSSTPPVVGARLDIPEECIIYVPMGTSNAYKEAMWWRRHDIVAMS